MDLIARLKAHEERSTVRRRYALTIPALERLESCLAALAQDGRIIRTCETGCGSSTVAFSHHAARHVVYCDDDTASGTADLAYVREHPDLRADRVSYIVGPTPETLFNESTLGEIDALLINGSHAYPIPDLEYFALERHLKPQGLLMISDIRVPAVKRMFDILLQDERLRLDRVVDSTAFFFRVADDAFVATEQDWRGQRYNRLSYPAHNWSAYTIGFNLPFSIVFDGGQKTLPVYFRSGFALDAGRPAMEGRRSTLSLPLDQNVSGEVEIILGIEVAAPVPPGTTLAVHYAGAKSICPIGDPGHYSVAMRARVEDAKRLHLSLVVSASPKIARPEVWSGLSPDRPFPKIFAITSLEARSIPENSVPVQGQRITATDGSIVRFDVDGQEFRFFVMDPNDSIQAHHNVGQIYELDELALISKHVKPGSRILDVGANIGNHAIWFEKALHAAEVVVLEPQPAVVALLKINCLLNDARRIDQSYLGVALGKEAGRGRIEIEDAYNVAGGRMVGDENGPLRIETGDSLLGDRNFDFVKIDVEGAELDVLIGLTSLLARCKPTVFVEVWDHGRDAFVRYLDQIGYACVDEFRRYPICSNLLLKPKP